MRKVTLVFIVVFFFVITYGFATSRVLSQSNGFDEAFGEYRNSLELYDTAHGEYSLARSQYLRLRTLTSKSEAKEKTRAMLEARDQALINYLTAIKEKINETEGITGSKKSQLSADLNTEINWFVNHKANLIGAGSLEDLVQDSAGASVYWLSIRPVVYRVLSEIPFGKVVDFRMRLGVNLSSVKNKVEEIRNEEREEYKLDTRKLEVIDRWTFETEGRLTRGTQKQDGTLPSFSSFTDEKLRRRNDKGVYESIVKKLLASVQDYQEASLFMREIIDELKTQ